MQLNLLELLAWVLKKNPGYRTLGGSMYAEGNLRTAMREFLKTEVKEGRLKLGEKICLE